MAHKFKVDFTGTKYQTRDGQPVKVYEIDEYQIYGRVIGCAPRIWSINGKDANFCDTPTDLIPVPQKVTLQECWVHYGPDGKSSYVTKNPDTPRPRGGYIRHIPAMEVDAND